MAKCILCKEEEINQQGYCENHLPRGWYKYRDGMKWVSVKEQLPEIDKKVLVVTDGDGYEENKEVFICHRKLFALKDSTKMGLRWDYAYSCGAITHWCEIPEKPE